MTSNTYLVRSSCFMAADPLGREGWLSAGIALSNTSGYDVQVHKIHQEFQVPVGQEGNSTQLIRLSSLSTNSPAVVLTPAAHDTGNAALPSQIICATGSEVYVQSALLRTAGSGDRGYNSAISTGWPSTQVASTKWGTVFKSTGQSQVQGIILRAGEGIAWIGKMTLGRRAMSAFATIRNTATNATYSVSANNVPCVPGVAMLAIMNNTGSGVTLSIDMLLGESVGSATLSTGASFRLAECKAVTGGDSLLSTSMDTGSVGVPAGITWVQNALVTPLAPEDIQSFDTQWELYKGGASLSGSTNALLYGILADGLETNGTIVRSGLPDYLQLNYAVNDIYSSQPGQPGIIIAPGRGLAVTMVASSGSPSLTNGMDSASCSAFAIWYSFSLHPGGSPALAGFASAEVYRRG